MKAVRIYFNVVGGTPIAMQAQGIRVLADTKHKRFFVRLGENVLECSEKEPPEIKPVKREGKSDLHLVYNFEFLKLRNKKEKDATFLVMKKEENTGDTRIALFINTKAIGNTEGKSGTYNYSPSHTEEYPWGSTSSPEGSSALEGVTVISPGEAITVTPEGGEPLTLRYDAKRGLLFEAMSVMAELIRHAEPERGQKKHPRPKKGESAAQQ